MLLTTDGFKIFSSIGRIFIPVDDLPLTVDF